MPVAKSPFPSLHRASASKLRGPPKERGTPAGNPRLPSSGTKIMSGRLRVALQRVRQPPQDLTKRPPGLHRSLASENLYMALREMLRHLRVYVL